MTNNSSPYRWNIKPPCKIAGKDALESPGNDTHALEESNALRFANHFDFDETLEQSEAQQFVVSLVECLAKIKSFPPKPCSNIQCQKEDCSVHFKKIGGK
jgi:hypothetical protein